SIFLEKAVSRWLDLPDIAEGAYLLGRELHLLYDHLIPSFHLSAGQEQLLPGPPHSISGGLIRKSARSVTEGRLMQFADPGFANRHEKAFRDLLKKTCERK
ncbi:MAG: hypothetical protein R3350_10110, partial [Saprospiraceae bacterium]|nr:hypothetical protein [Saprospiraceae bacterium]